MLWLTTPAWSQEIEARRWSHLPIGANFLGGGYAYTSADINFDPVLLLDDVKQEVHTFPIKYLRSFELLERSARFELWQAYSKRLVGHVSALGGESHWCAAA